MNLFDEAIKVALTVLGSYVFYRLTFRHPRLSYFLSGFTSCSVTGPAGPGVVWIYQITIQNTGKAPARNVRVAHFHLPFSWQVIQTVPHNVEKVNGVDRIIHFDTIEPGMLITIAYLDTNHQQITTAHDHIRSDDGVVQQTPVQLTRVFPKPVRFLLSALLLLGAYTVISTLYDLLHWLWPILSSGQFQAIK